MRMMAGTLGIVALAAGLSACGTGAAVPAVGTQGTTTNSVITTLPVTTTTTLPATTTTTIPATTTTVASPYPKGEPGDKGFAVASLSESPDALGNIGGTIRITNVGSQSYTVSFTVTFFPTAAETGTPLGSAIGTANAVSAGQTVTETISSEDPDFSNANFYYQFQVDAEF